MHRAANNYRVSWPSMGSLCISTLTLFVLCTVVLTLSHWMDYEKDTAKLIALVIFPTICASHLIQRSGLTWRFHFKRKLAYSIPLWTYWLLGSFWFFQLQSIKDGSPIIDGGWVYELALAFSQ